MGGAGGQESTNYAHGGAGTVYLKDNAVTYGDLVIDNNDTSNSSYDHFDLLMGRTPLTPSGTPASLNFNDVTISNYGNLDLNSDTTLNYAGSFAWDNQGWITDNGGSLDILNSNATVTVPLNSTLFANTSKTWSSITVNGDLTHSQNRNTQNEYVINLTTTGDFTVNSNGQISVTGAGHTTGYGQGAGERVATHSSGGGHGGIGGDSSDGSSGGSTYDNSSAPSIIGSGAGYNNADYYPESGAGGGAVKISVRNNMIVNGDIHADAEPANPGSSYSGGSGGSIWLVITGTLTGGGDLTAAGGEAGGTDSGDGGGGLIYVETSDYSGYTGSTDVTAGTTGTTEPVAEDGVVTFYVPSPEQGNDSGDIPITIGIDNEPPFILASNIYICNDDSIATSSAAMSACAGADISNGINLTAATSEAYTVVFLAYDPSGADDLGSPTAAFFETGVSGAEDCSDDNNDCYGGTSGLSCTKASDASGTSSYFKCPLALEYYANESIAAGSWSTYVEVTDNSGSTGSQVASTEEINKLVAATFGNIAFGSLALGYETPLGQGVTVPHYNNGNTPTDFSVAANSDLTCDDIGFIPATVIKFDDEYNPGWSGSGYTLSQSATAFNTLDTTVRTNDSSTSEHLTNSYWSIKIPGSGVLGTCTATLTAVAQEG